MRHCEPSCSNNYSTIYQQLTGDTSEKPFTIHNNEILCRKKTNTKIDTPFAHIKISTRTEYFTRTHKYVLNRAFLSFYLLTISSINYTHVVLLVKRKRSDKFVQNIFQLKESLFHHNHSWEPDCAAWPSFIIFVETKFTCFQQQTGAVSGVKFFFLPNQI